MPDHRHRPHDPEDFASFYAEGPRWSGNPNAALVREAAPLNPGRALDIGCGEGADVAWLAERGWRVTGLDPVGAALDRARELLDARGLDAELIHTALDDFQTTEPFDLVACSYLPVGEEAVAAVEKLVAPGGTLLWVHHDFADDDHAFVLPARVAELLGEGFTVTKLENVARDVPHGAGAHHTRDVVLVAERNS